MRTILRPENFDLALWDKSLPKDALTTSEGRKEASCVDPLSFALIYLSHHLEDEEGVISFSESHFEWITDATQWITRQPSRDCYVAPRGCGKSTWHFLILPIWAAAFGHVDFIGAFADSGPQAQLHLSNFKRELSTNELLKKDFPDLCVPERRNGRPVADNETTYIANSGFAFIAKGIDSQSLGMKIGTKRPDLLILDDIEPDESNYSTYQMEKRLTSILDSVFYLNLRARVVLSGTVTMSGSIIHQLVKSLEDKPEPWIVELNPPMRIHHHLPIIIDDEGNERSIWPLKWPLDYLQGIRHTRDYKKNFDNNPLSADGDYWSPTDFEYGDVEGITRTVLSVDPAVTSKRDSDYTGISVVGFSPSEKKFLVSEALHVKLPPAFLRQRVLNIIEEYPVNILLVEGNQGQDVWRAIFHDMPVPIRIVSQTMRKEVRAARLLNHYQRNRVKHVRRLNELESEQLSFPKGMHDDLLDSVGSGVEYILSGLKKRRPAESRQLSYL